MESFKKLHTNSIMNFNSKKAISENLIPGVWEMPILDKEIDEKLKEEYRNQIKERVEPIIIEGGYYATL